MNLEIPEIKKEQAPDDLWSKRLAEFGKFQDFKYLEGDQEYREGEKERFINEKKEAPELDLPKLETMDFVGIEQSLLNFKKDILAEEKHPVIRQAYHWRINEKIAELRMLKAAKDADDKRFLKYSNYIYGKPQKEVYDYTLSTIKNKIEGNLASEDSEISEAAKRLYEELFSAYVPQDTTIKFVESGVATKKDTSGEKEYVAEEIAGAFAEALTEMKAYDWSVVLSRTSKGINIDHETKKVAIPENKKLKETKLKGLIKHEIGTHIKRAKNGERSSGLKLLGIGLDRFWKGDEGIATYEQQKIEGASDFAGFEGHLAVALATGVDGKKRNFRDVFEILRDYYFINSKEKNKKDALKKSIDKAWNRSIRTFRGTSGKTPGACFTKDIIYREGNIGIYRIILDNPDEEIRFQVGLYDPSNPRHIWILEQLGISDEDLETLDK